MITWIASYPKSGSTWVRAFLAGLAPDRGSQPPLEGLAEAVPSAAFRPLLDEALGVETSDLTEDEVETARPVAYAHLARAAPGVHRLKIHDARTGPGGSIVPVDATAGAVVLVRNPLDVAVSLAHHMDWSADRAIDFMGDPGATLAPAGPGLSIQVRQRLGRWSDHVDGWLDAAEFPVLRVRYEDLLASPLEEFARLAAFTDPAAGPAAIERAVERCGFDVLRAAERDAGFAEAAASERPFFHRGASGAGRATLTNPQIERIVREHDPVMRRLGYIGADPDVHEDTGT